jgi:hypothetical protein
MPQTYEPIATANGTGASGLITFTGIPATYTDLVLVFSGANSTSGNNIELQFNNDTGANYSLTRLYGSGSGSGASDRTSSLLMTIGNADNQTVAIANIMNYTNTTTYKTVLFRLNPTAAYVAAEVGLWRATPAAINRIDLRNTGGFITAASTITLYGIKAA